MGNPSRQLASPLGKVVGSKDGQHTRVSRETWRKWGVIAIGTEDPDLSPQERDTVIVIAERRHGPRSGGDGCAQ